METFTIKERAVNFSRIERDRLQSLIKKYKDIMFTKKTDNISNIKKSRAWAAIHAEFNAGGGQPRTLRQLKDKFDNMKRNARKDASQARQSQIRTAGGSPAPLVKQETEYIRTVMPVSMDGLPSAVDNDFIENQATVSISKDSQEVHDLNPRLETSNVKADEHDETMNPNENIIPTVADTDMLTENVFESKSQSALLRRRTPISKSVRIHKKSQNYSENKRYADLKSEILRKTREDEEHIYKLRIKHMEEKRKEETEIYELQKKKLTLEISLLEKKREHN